MTASPGPHSGDDTFDLIDDALTTLAERRGAWLGDDLTAITLIASLIDQAERCLPQLVHDARANGHSWHQIAQALATSPDQARLRFDPQSPVADSRWPYDWLPEPPHQRPQPPRPHPPLHANPYLALHASSYADTHTQLEAIRILTNSEMDAASPLALPRLSSCTRTRGKYPAT